MPRALIALGTNLGDRSAMLADAAERIEQLIAAGDLTLSQPYETSPAGGPAGQAPFLNAAIAVQTELDPHRLLAALQAIEQQLGRVRGERWGARLIDLDLLLYDDAQGVPLVTATASLQVPHPRLAFRRFALQPAADVAADMLHPIFGRTVSQLLDHLNAAPRYVALFGGTAQRRNALAQALAAATGATALLDPRENPAAPLTGGTPQVQGSSGPATGSPLQFLDETTGLLASRDWRSQQWVVSAFFVPEFAAELLIADVAHEAADPVVRRADALVPEPRLLAVLDDWDALVAVHRGVLFEGDPKRQNALAVALAGNAPVLCAGRVDFDAQLRELAAALVAME